MESINNLIIYHSKKLRVTNHYEKVRIIKKKQNKVKIYFKNGDTLELILNEEELKKHPADCVTQSWFECLIEKLYTDKLGKLYTLEDVKDFKVGSGCFLTYPCQHMITFIFEDDTTLEEMMGAEDIVKLLKHFNRKMSHFSYLEDKNEKQVP